MPSGRLAKYTTAEEMKNAKIEYNKRYYMKKHGELKTKRIKKTIEKKPYSDEKVRAIIKHVGYERILQLLI